mmetsp:Transcript_9030/g.28081  ORF Transcript_9030/g.28081 Transcript_9030/m.28081 type:complete len:244 (-) Transcript_9030:918-1649(-)
MVTNRSGKAGHRLTSTHETPAPCARRDCPSARTDCLNTNSVLRYAHCVSNVPNEACGEPLHVVCNLHKGALDIHRERLAHRRRTPPTLSSAGRAPPAVLGGNFRQGAGKGCSGCLHPGGIPEGPEVCARRATGKGAGGHWRTVGDCGEAGGIAAAKSRSCRLAACWEITTTSSAKGAKLLRAAGSGGRKGGSTTVRPAPASAAEGSKVGLEAAIGSAGTFAGNRIIAVGDAAAGPASVEAPAI